MVLRAAFIGINKYQSANIRELIGARRDAQALHALCLDTFTQIDAKLLIDEQATTEAIRRVFKHTLDDATNQDIVILSFAGHGTNNHRLVTYNTLPSSINDTTIPMTELAEQFRRSQAKIILCILDCCFSGKAPARVFEDTPITRTSFSLDIFAGNGRVLVAASGLNEEAIEFPSTGHGLLTHILLEILQTDFASLTSAIEEAITRVRVEAAKVGYNQNPVMIGYINGGLSFPRLKSGHHYSLVHPKPREHLVTSNISDLQIFQLPNTILTEWIDRFQSGLNELQQKAVNEFHILNGRSLLVVSPTSSGKTFIGEMAAVKAAIEGRKAVFLFPYKALVNEKYDQFKGLYEANLKTRVIRCSGDYQDHTLDFIRGKYEIALLTYEMFLNLMVTNPHILNQIGLVVLDEAQFITDPTRGITVELLLTYLLNSRSKNTNFQFIVLSAVIGNINHFDKWLNIQTLQYNKRPVELTEGVLDRSGVFQYLDKNGQPQTEQLLPFGSIIVRREKPSSQDIIVPLVRLLVGRGEKVIVFRNQKGKVQGSGRYLANDLGLEGAINTVMQLPVFDTSSASTDLRYCLEHGIAFHNANLTREERSIVERAFRDSQNNVRVLTATTTVAAGINTPASTVILAEQEFVGEDGRAFTVSEYKNMAGRAGRLGFQEQGKAIILADNSVERDRLFRQYVQGHLEPLLSSFDVDHLETWVVRLLAQVKSVPRKEVINLLASTYGGYLANLANPDWMTKQAAQLEASISKMISLGLVEEENEAIRLTLLGRACGESTLSFASAMRLVELLRKITSVKITSLHLLCLIQALSESDGGYTPLMKRGQGEAQRIQQAVRKFGKDVIQLLQSYAIDIPDYQARCKRACILHDWISGIPIETIEQEYSPNPYQGKISYGDIRKFADNTRFHLRSAYKILTILLVEDIPVGEEIENLLKQLEIGIPADGLGLLDIELNLGRGEYLTIYKYGILSASAFRTLTEKEVAELLGDVFLERFKGLQASSTA